MQLNQITPLDFKNVAKLPDSHRWTLSSENPSQDPLTQESVPIIDLNDPHAPSLIREANENWGMFQLTNHGVPITLMQEIQSQTQRLFALPADQKLLAARSPDGLTGYGMARISSFLNKQLWFEGFTIIGSPAQHASQFWPNDYTTFCDVVEEYQKEMKGLSERLIGLMFKSLGLAQEDVKWFTTKSETQHQPQSVLQLNSYPICPEAGQAMGLAPHTDSTLLTLVHQNNASGLQVFREGSGWVPVHPVDGALVVNIGDLMQILSNGRFKSVLHRAVVNETYHRTSVVHFYGPPMDAEVSPLMHLIDFDHPVLYRAVSWKEYLDAKKIHFDKTLDFIKQDALGVPKNGH
ncbi:hypothetical protein JCGZ_13258 [Jatropha curcas]|uniref:gibberellin 3beta-dioxygenase n=1 Tax=Jatropha curcas TaxID=180498 RepID=A0A067KBF6_JATCU|nr:gibberellin 3-beta-dioxygenase 1 [Jatropha curcas]KDP32333.1 hypothetical protein JCGZ_13258 [Jatropha curcas]